MLYAPLSCLKTNDNKTKSSLICKTTNLTGLVRMNTSKFFVSYADYTSKKYPEYCQGKKNPTQAQKRVS